MKKVCFLGSPKHTLSEDSNQTGRTQPNVRFQMLRIISYWLFTGKGQTKGSIKFVCFSFLFLHENTSFGYSLQALLMTTTINIRIFGLKNKTSYLWLWRRITICLNQFKSVNFQNYFLKTPLYTITITNTIERLLRVASQQMSPFCKGCFQDSQVMVFIFYVLYI